MGNGKAPGAAPAGWSSCIPAWVGCVLWGLPGSGKGWKPSWEGWFGRKAWRPPRRLGQESLELNIAPLQVAEWGRRDRAGAGKNQGGLRRGEEGENKRICVSTLPPSFLLPSLLFLVFFPSLQLRNLDTPTSEKRDPTICARVHKFWVVKIVLPLCGFRQIKKISCASLLSALKWEECKHLLSKDSENSDNSIYDFTADNMIHPVVSKPRHIWQQMLTFLPF